MKHIKISFNQLMCIICAVFLFVSWRMAVTTATVISKVQEEHRDEVRELKIEIRELRESFGNLNEDCYVDNLGQAETILNMGWDIEDIYTTLQEEGILDGC
jgi:hypothetical protein